MTRDIYTHGHHASVTAHHSVRTVKDSAAFLAPHLAPGARVLDVGCGPGSVTQGLASLVFPGSVIGIDVAADVIDLATRKALDAHVTNVEFKVGDVYSLPFDSESFDVAFAHQVLQHVTDPVASLREMRRVTARGGAVAARDADYGAFAWAPQHTELSRWNEIYHRVTQHNGVQADAGRHLRGWFRSAGFTDLTVSTSNWHYATPDTCAWWGEGWAVRVVESEFAHQAVEYGYSTRAELQQISDAFLWWSLQEDAFFLIPHVEVVGLS